MKYNNNNIVAAKCLTQKSIVLTYEFNETPNVTTVSASEQIWQRKVLLNYRIS